MFQVNDPRFWKSLLGVISLFVGGWMAWFILNL
ncbi:putative conserved membrane protein [Synechococcus sp. BIOS-U3-1]|nr:putative conserved membrane protein [Synechococcus sp. BIOS-U3-1]